MAAGGGWMRTEGSLGISTKHAFPIMKMITITENDFPIDVVAKLIHATKPIRNNALAALNKALGGNAEEDMMNLVRIARLDSLRRIRLPMILKSIQLP